MTRPEARPPASRVALAIALLLWACVVLAFFGARHPVRSGGLWVSYLSGLAADAVLVLAATALGSRVLRATRRLPGRAGERWLLSAGLGLSLLACATFALGLGGLLYPAVGWVLVSAALLSGLRDLREAVLDLRTADRAWGHLRTDSAVLLLLCLPFLAAPLWLALAPASAHDALVYHLRIPAHYAEIHRITPIPLNVYSHMPHNLEVLSTLAFLLGGETGARAMDFVMRLLLALSLFSLASRRLPAAGALLALAVFLSNPLVVGARTVGNIDLGMAFLFVLAVLAVPEEGRRGWALWPAAWLAGFLAGCKYTGGFLTLSVLGFMAVRLWPLRPREWAVLLGFPAVAIAPWLVKSAVFTGNPVYPLLPGLFESKEWSPALGDRLVAWQRSMGMGRGFARGLLLPWNLAVEGQPGRNYQFFDGVLSALPLAFLPLVGLLRERGHWLRLVALTIVPFVGWALTSQQMRVLIPLLPLTAVVTAGVLWNVDREAFGLKTPWIRRAGIASTVVFLALFQAPGLARNVAAVLPAVTGEQSREEYLTEAVQPFAVIRKANETLPRDARVLMLWESRGYYLERPYLADSFFEASQIAERAAAAGSPEAFAADLRREGITHVIYNHGLGRFFENLYGPEYASFLAGFVSGHLEALFSERDVTLYRLRP